MKMKQYLTIIFSLFIFLSCKKNEDTSPPTSTAQTTITPISTDFKQFENRFFSLAAAKGITPTTTNLTIVYSTDHTTADGILGVCTRSAVLREVSINKVYWESWAANARKEDMEQLMFHELGHCTLLRNHFDTTTSVGGVSVAQSIMNAYHLSKTYYNANYNYYIDELFNPSIVGTVALNTSGTNGFDGGIYASSGSTSTYTMTISNFYDNKYQDNSETNLGIEEFRCDEE